MDIEQAAITATHVQLKGKGDIIIHRDAFNPGVIVVLIVDYGRDQDIVHEVNVIGELGEIRLEPSLRRECCSCMEREWGIK